MDKSLERKLKITRKVSGSVLIASILLMVSTACPGYAGHEVLSQILIASGVILFILYIMVPACFLLVNKQAFAIAWSRGLLRWKRLKDVDLNNIPRADKAQMVANFIMACIMLVIFYLFIEYVVR